jgi:hypothetical protein
MGTHAFTKDNWRSLYCLPNSAHLTSWRCKNILRLKTTCPFSGVGKEEVRLVEGLMVPKCGDN